MGLQSEKMSNEAREEIPATASLIDSNNSVEAAAESGESDRDSPVSSEDSAVVREAAQSSAAADAPVLPATEPNAYGEIIAPQASAAARAQVDLTGMTTAQVYPIPADASGPSELNDSRRGKAARSVSQENCDVAEATGLAATTVTSSYQALEEKMHSEFVMQPRDVLQAATSDEAAETVDGPPRIITTNPVVSPLLGPIPTKTSRRERRRGKWTVEEEAYVARVIQDFNSGFLDAPAGTTLRTYLSDKLNCDPMRITKKFTGEACIGKRVFHPAVRSASNAPTIDRAQSELTGLERRWRRRLELQQRESAKKAAASAAAAAAAASARDLSLDPGAEQQNPILQTATWLDRAKNVTCQPSDSIEALPRSEVMSQMEEVQKLLSEGSTMQLTGPGLPLILEQAAVQFGTSTAGTESPSPEPADKRLRTGAEDAEALVGFLRSVRASAASGQEF